MDFASLCLLSFERPDFLIKSFESLKRNTRFPYELIVNDDGSFNQHVSSYLTEQFFSKQISWLILNGGKNMGIGKSFRNCIGVSSGQYIFKLDADLEYFDGWLKTVTDILRNNVDVGACGLFNYQVYDPSDNRFGILEEREDCYIVEDFVNSGYGFKREIFDLYGHNLQDDGWQVYIKQQGYKLAIPKVNVVHNFGFGKNSIYVKADGSVQGKSEFPKIFKK